MVLQSKSLILQHHLLPTQFIIEPFLFVVMLGKFRSNNPKYGLIFIFTALSVNGFGRRILAIMESLDRLSLSLDKIGYGNNHNLHIYPVSNPKEGNKLIDLQNIGISFGNKKIISDLNMQINRGDKILIKGDNGSGKTTLAKIIKGILVADYGKVIHYIDYDDIGYYSQKMTLFNRSLEENINYPNNTTKDINYQKIFNELNFMDGIDASNILEKTRVLWG